MNIDANVPPTETYLIPCCILNRGPVGVKEEVKMSATFTATRKGKHHVTVSFQSNELSDVHGECTMSDPEAT